MGLRCNELLKAKWWDLDWDSWTLFIGLTKSGEPLLMPISDAAMGHSRSFPGFLTTPAHQRRDSEDSHPKHHGKARAPAIALTLSPSNSGKAFFYSFSSGLALP